MTASRAVVGLAFSLSPVILLAQAKPEVSYYHDGDRSQRSFALVVDSAVLTVNGDWHPLSSLTSYAHDHAGTYIVFAQKGELHRLDAPKQVAEAQLLYAPMRELAAQQEALAAEQRPLAAQQQALGAEQRAATDPHEMTRIGAQQAAVGAEQAGIGQQQGAIGREQGTLGRAFYNRVQAMLEACLTAGSCPRVSSENARQ